MKCKDWILVFRIPLRFVLNGLIFVVTSTGQTAEEKPIVPVVICSERLTITKERTALKLPYQSNKSLSAVDETVKKAVIVVHGNSRNANDYYNYIVEAAQTSNVTDTVIIAPQFLTDDDLKVHSLTKNILYWSGDGWKEGDASLTAPYKRPWGISSFSVMDMFIEQISNRSIFPNLTSVVIAGHSAGGQYVNRYAAGSRIEQHWASLGNSYRYICANPSSYLYLNEERRKSDKIDRFGRVPKDKAKKCKGYNKYKYGLDDLNSYMSNVGARAIRNQYKSKNVVYLLGKEDNNREDSSQDTSCAADLQGAYRLERGLIFYNYLRDFYDPTVYKHHVLSIVPGVGHDGRAMFISEVGRSNLFGH